MAILDVNLGSSSQTISAATPGYDPGENTTISVQSLGSNSLTVDGITATVEYDVLALNVLANTNYVATNGANVTIELAPIAVGALANSVFTVDGASSMTVDSSALSVSILGSQSVAFTGAGAGSFTFDHSVGVLGGSIDVTGFGFGDSLAFTGGDSAGSTFKNFTFTDNGDGTADAQLIFDDLTATGSPPFEVQAGDFTFSLKDIPLELAQAIATDPDQFFVDGKFTAPVCFVKGTLIDTDKGAQKIETLSIGDLVVTSKGLRPVKWLGFREYSPAWLRQDEARAALCPVRIQAGAIAQNVPSSDILVSPWHHIQIDGMLYRAKDLLNGRTIRQELDVRAISYWHIELEEFDVIQAHGIMSESWADGGNRNFFQNIDLCLLRDGQFERRGAARPGFKVVKEKHAGKMRKALEARAEELAATLAQPTARVA